MKTGTEIKQADVKKTSFKNFMLERSFSDARVIHRISEKPVLLKPEQLANVKKEAYDKGFEDGRISVDTEHHDKQISMQKEQASIQKEQVSIQKEQASIQQAQNELLSEMINKAKDITGRLQDTLKEQEDEIRRVALAISKKILPAFVSRFGADDITAIVSHTLQEMKREPRVVVKLNAADFEVLNDKLQAMAEEQAFHGKLIVITDNKIQQGDCLVEWTEGGVEKNIQNTLNEIDKIVTPAT
ncbi:MAG: FliH/SctL family protein [Alphaproteobacteria bacterium]|nr:FliH/SctL family protein [Alphaproteobacteria bacterium]MCL2505735.1 FliH/SctL family protein [Alphaproteobacteria bacterium]